MSKTIDEKAKGVCRDLHLPENGPAFFFIRDAIEEQDRDTRHACAEAVSALPPCEAPNENAIRDNAGEIVNKAICADAARAACLAVGD